MTNNKFSQN